MIAKKALTVLFAQRSWSTRRYCMFGIFKDMNANNQKTNSKNGISKYPQVRKIDWLSSRDGNIRLNSDIKLTKTTTEEIKHILKDSIADILTPLEKSNFKDNLENDLVNHHTDKISQYLYLQAILVLNKLNKIISKSDSVILDNNKTKLKQILKNYSTLNVLFL